MCHLYKYSFITKNLLHIKVSPSLKCSIFDYEKGAQLKFTD